MSAGKMWVATAIVNFYGRKPLTRGVATWRPTVESPKYSGDWWSLVVEITGWALLDRFAPAKVHFLVQDAPHDQLRRFQTFTLYEGSRDVATCLILSDAVLQ